MTKPIKQPLHFWFFERGMRGSESNLQMSVKKNIEYMERKSKAYFKKMSFSEGRFVDGGMDTGGNWQKMHKKHYEISSKLTKIKL